MTFTILAVCTGNVCRSPIAELVLARRLAGLAGVSVRSAGVGALVGNGVPESARLLAARLGIDASGHVARQLDTSLIGGGDLILAMAREHRRHVVETSPAAIRRTFTVRELARIADEVEARLPDALAVSQPRSPGEGMRTAIALANALRGTVPPPDNADEFDVVDPFGHGPETYERSFTQLIPAAERVSLLLSRAEESISEQ